MAFIGGWRVWVIEWSDIENFTNLKTSGVQKIRNKTKKFFFLFLFHFSFKISLFISDFMLHPMFLNFLNFTICIQSRFTLMSNYS